MSALSSPSFSITGVAARAALLAAALLVSFPSAVHGLAPPIQTDDSCTCYQTNGSTASVFANRRFFDFRSLKDQAAVPAVLRDLQSNAAAPTTSSFFESASWTSMWQAQTWDNAAALKDPAASGTDATVLMVNSPNNIYIERDDDGNATAAAGTPQTHMTMRTARVGALQTAAELDSVSAGFQYLSVRMEARTLGPPGAVAAMFTYRPPPSSAAVVQEADLEILTRDPPTHIQYTNQPGSSGPDATRNATLPAGRRWTQWATHRIDWTPGRTTWYVDGLVAAQIAFQAPRDPALFLLNCWSNGGAWSGVMADGDEAFLQIRWLDMVFNSTDAAYAPPAGGCQTVCRVDETQAQGTPSAATTATAGMSSAATAITGTGRRTTMTTTTRRLTTTLPTSRSPTSIKTTLKTSKTSKTTQKTTLKPMTTTKTTLKPTTSKAPLKLTPKSTLKPTTSEPSTSTPTTASKTTTLVASMAFASETPAVGSSVAGKPNLLTNSGHPSLPFPGTLFLVCFVFLTAYFLL